MGEDPEGHFCRGGVEVAFPVYRPDFESMLPILKAPVALEA